LEAAAIMVTSGAYVGVLPLHYATLLRRRFPIRRWPKAGIHYYRFGAIIDARRTLSQVAAEVLRSLVDEHKAERHPA
jgi:hypothetical protein